MSVLFFVSLLSEKPFSSTYPYDIETLRTTNPVTNKNMQDFSFNFMPQISRNITDLFHCYVRLNHSFEGSLKLTFVKNGYNLSSRAFGTTLQNKSYNHMSTVRNLNVHKTFKRCSGYLLDVL